MIKHAYLIEARGHPGHDVIRNFYQSQGLEDGKIYSRQFRCVGKDEWVMKKVKDKDGNEKEQEGWKGGDGENTVNLQQVIQGTYSTMVGKFPILRTAGHKFTPGVATMWTREEFGKMFENPIFNTFNTVLEMIVEFHKNDYDGYLRRIRKDKKQIELIDKNTPTAEELIDRFRQAREENIQATKDRINSKEYTNTKYFIRPITEHNDLLRYKGLCYKNDVWCLMNGEQAWKHYTSNGIYQFYLVLDKRLCNENGDPILENKDIIPAKQGEGHPNDEYGLSMIGIIVDMDGELAYCTSRWNHAGEGDDHTMTSEEISNTLGVNFYQTFKPNHVFQDAIEKALAKYRETGSLDGFDWVGDFNDDFAKVGLSYKFNFITTEGKIVSDIWFDKLWNFYNGIAIVSIKDKGYNFINTNGELISDIWFDDIEDFHEGFASVQIGNKGWNFINTNGQLIFNTWFNYVKPFSEGWFCVKINSKGWNFINIKGEFLNDNWYDDANSFYNGVASVYYKKLGFNFINTQGNLISKDFFENYLKYKDNIYQVITNDNTKLLFNTNGEIMTSDDYVKTTLNNFYKSGDIKLFDRIKDSNLENYRIVTILEKSNYLNIKTNEFLSNIWFNYVEPFTNSYAKVYKNNMGYNIINTRGELISNEWFKEVHIIDERVKIVKTENDGMCFLKTNGDLIDINNEVIRNVSPQQNGEQIANESLKRKYAKELNEVLNLNKRIKILYE